MVVLPLKQYSNFENTTTQNGGAVNIELTQLSHVPCGQPTQMYREHKTLHQLHAVDADSRSAAQKITHIKCIPLAHSSLHKIPPLGGILSQMNPVHIFKALFKINLNCIEDHYLLGYNAV
jgi:hypothetical protein